MPLKAISGLAYYIKQFVFAMRNCILLIVSVLAFSIATFGQSPEAKRDRIWLFGYGYTDSLPQLGWATLDFGNENVEVVNDLRFISLFEDNASICDTNGNLLFYTNGIKIANSENQLMLNGNGLNPGIYTAEFPDGFTFAQGSLALPAPGNADLYFLVHGDFGISENPTDPFIYTPNLYYSLIDMSKNNGLGAVIEKNVKILADTLPLGKITAVRHGNGRDWWVVVPEKNSNCYYRFLLDTNGLSAPMKQCLGIDVENGLGQAFFSPDGTKYARNDLIGGGAIDDILNIYDFDRCSGLLSNQYQFAYADSALAGGLSFSPNSRYLYIPHHTKLFQFDTEATDIGGSMKTVAEYDGFVAPFPTTFYLSHLAPDGKIYICSPNGVNYLHVINQPDELGTACEVVQHGVELPTYSLTMPNFANFHLGKWEASPCDTIGTSNESSSLLRSHVFVYPNPASSFIIVDYELVKSGPFTFTLFDVIGREVLTEQLQGKIGEQKISIQNVSAGMYFFKVSDGDQQLKMSKILIIKE
ncbi:MAG: T9SS type A sorting domain-containing protein [Bacteroidetes bacterium]|nr:T9SS type A sorting domain-containing protein [Bacteroidota bacterium]